MSKMILAAALAAASLGGVALSSGAAFANDMRAQAPNGYIQQGSPSSDGGLGRYCPPGLYPHSYTGGTGVRCQYPDGTLDGYGL